jgi:uncharacterized protein (TIGR03118 family)
MRLGSTSRKCIAVATLSAGALVASTLHAKAGADYVQTNLVSDVPGLAVITDPGLVNPWGVAESATSPFWLSDQGTNESTLYTVNSTGVSKNALTVAIPTTATGPQGPTGQVFNSTTAFTIGASPAHFIFANLNGTISAWAGGTTATVEATTTGAVYTGLAIDPNSKQLYAANGAQNRIDVFNGSFAPVALGPSAFIDPNLPSGLVPFNVQNIGGQIYVTYAPAGHAAQAGATAGQGVVDVFDTSGNFVKRLITGSALASPWGVALAPNNFGAYSGDLLVSNFSYADSEINAFDPNTGALLGTIAINDGPGNTPGGLWALTFGNGGSGGNPDTLYFTDGINGETAGLFAALTVPEPSGLLLVAPMLVLLAARARQRASGATVKGAVSPLRTQLPAR